MKFQMLRGVASALPILNEGELAFCLDTNQLWIGNGQQNMLIGDPLILERLKAVNDQLIAANKTILDQITQIKERLDDIEETPPAPDPNPPIGDKIDADTLKGHGPEEFVYLSSTALLSDSTDNTPATAARTGGIDADTLGGHSVEEFVFIGN